MNCEHYEDILAIPEGNDFRLHICGSDIVPGYSDARFEDVEGLVAYITSFPNIKTEVEYQTQGTDIIISVTAEKQRKTVYGIEFVGTYGGHSWRWKAKRGFRIVDSNCEASMQGNETFGVETYWLGDILEVDTDGDTMIFTTHGHATIEGGILTVQETANTKADLDGDTIIFTTKSI